MTLLTVDHIEVFYGELQALFGLSLEVDAGETVAIVGANGAGKTTLLRTIAGMLAPQQGGIHYRGNPVVGHPPYQLNRQGIALVPEGRQIFPSLSVEDNLKVGAFSGRSGRWDLDTIYQLFPRLKERANFGGTDLSGGEQQMLAIGRALMSNPDLILMDEISLGLAPVIVKTLYETVATLSQSGMTIIIVEQDVNQALSVANRIYCLLEGKVSLAGRSDALTSEQISKAYFGI